MSDTPLTTEQKTEQLALQGGLKAVSTIEGKGQPKIGAEEFVSVAERFGFEGDELARIRDIAETRDWEQGPFLANYYSDLPETKVNAFERVAKEVMGAPFATGVSSGTGALHSAFVACGVGPGREVICPAVGFYATAAAVAMAGGVPVFCDVDESLSMDPDKLDHLINERTVALAPTHTMGGICPMDRIMQVARKHNLKVVEDCAQSCGGRLNGQFVGTFGDFGCFSISAYKIVGGGEGGLVLCKNQEDWDRVNGLAEGGGLWRPNRFGETRYEGELIIGGNYRMSEIEAAVDVVQMSKMEQTVGRFREAFGRTISQLETFTEITPKLRHTPDGEVGYTLRFFSESVELAVKIAEALNAEGVGAGTRGGDGNPDWHIYHHMLPLKQHFACNCYDGDGQSTYAHGTCPVADDLFERMVSIGINQWYTQSDCDHIAAGINKVLRAYCTPAAGGRPW
jgi:8-amino-3,8-dideoxy-alpha-D-manno-octulosonate transaminase